MIHEPKRSARLDLDWAYFCCCVLDEQAMSETQSFELRGVLDNIAMNEPLVHDVLTTSTEFERDFFDRESRFDSPREVPSFLRHLWLKTRQRSALARHNADLRKGGMT